MVRETGCDGVAIGRGCQGRPWLFANIKNAFEGNPERSNPNLGEVWPGDSPSCRAAYRVL